MTPTTLSIPERDALEADAFGLPERRAYPIPTVDHARDSLARALAYGSPEDYRRVKAAVAVRYPHLRITTGRHGGHIVQSEVGGDGRRRMKVYQPREEGSSYASK